MLDSTRLLLDLRQVSDIAQRISGCLDPAEIARQVTDALVTQFNCALARIWLTEPNQQSLRLVASSGLYTHINGSFASVAMGAYKVGKIAQNRVPFLSNHLADEPWVKDRDWAIHHQIQGFAGYPLLVSDRVLGVLATFSHQAMAPEFLETLQVLCLSTTIALDAALQMPQVQPPSEIWTVASAASLSDQLARMLTTTQLMLVGTERALPPSLVYVGVQAGAILNQLHCSYCRLTYTATTFVLEAIVRHPASVNIQEEDLPQEVQQERLDDLQVLIRGLGGTLGMRTTSERSATELWLSLPYPAATGTAAVSIQCQSPLLQTAFTALCYQAGLTLADGWQAHSAQFSHPQPVLLTDCLEFDPGAIANMPLVWIHHNRQQSVPPRAIAWVDLDIQPENLRTLITRVSEGKPVPLSSSSLLQPLSEREREILLLLAQGCRDREIAERLHISASTVKFHVNNTLLKLKAKNRYQAVYEAAIHGWI